MNERKSEREGEVCVRERVRDRDREKHEFNYSSCTIYFKDQLEIQEYLEDEGQTLTKLYCVAEVLWNGQELHVSYTNEITLLYIKGQFSKTTHRGFMVHYEGRIGERKLSLASKEIFCRYKDTRLSFNEKYFFFDE